ncbi:MAG TPA: FAD-dependent oxidoreductase [Gemmataceae bacterium]|nr:FAD-dependent oxidoreductase [Gemmataceae bacterium]
MPKVAILGGGVGGLSAAHELIERGFSVAVYEAKNMWGGKARSMGKPGSGKDGRMDLPGEHGFRFFPGFYKHLPDTMKRIPFPGNDHGVYDNLTHTTQTGILQEGAPPIVMPANFPTTLHQWMQTLHTVFHSHFGIPAHEAWLFSNQLLIILSSCKQRRLAEYEKIPWWEFIQAKNKSKDYKKLLGIGLTRSLVAMKAEVASTRTVGDILLQLLLNSLTPGVMVDRVLNGPTNQVWIEPWIDHLKKHKAGMFLNAKTVRLNFDGQKISSATVEINGKEENVQADYYICAFPVEVLNRLVTDDIKKAAPSLARTARLGTQWMNGIQFYLRRDVPVINGHGLYLDSAWALTSISQHQFWPNVDFSRYGDGRVRGIISVDISDWFTAGNKVVKLQAHECDPEQIRKEVWAQLVAHLDAAGQTQIDDDDLLDWHLDPDIIFPRCHTDNEGNEEPLLVNTIGSWEDRPEANVEIPNLFLASDYVRTNTDLATMEGANEAARRAVNAILRAARSRAHRCKIWPLHEPVVFAPLRGYDWIRFKLGLKHGGWVLGMIICAVIVVGIAGGLVGAVMSLAELNFLAAVGYIIVGLAALTLAWPILRTVVGLFRGKHLLVPVPHPDAVKK